MIAKETFASLGDLTKEEFYAITPAETLSEAHLLLDAYRKEKKELEDTVRLLREHAQDRIHTGSKLSILLLSAASLLETKECNIHFLRGVSMGLKHRAEEAERKLAQ